MTRYAYRAEVRIPAEISHTGEARTISIEIVLDAVNSREATQKADDIGQAKGLLLVDRLTQHR